jgi:uncharacterized protein
VTDVTLAQLLPPAFIAGLVVGFLKASIGGGIGLVLSTTLTIVLPPRIVLGLGAPLLCLSDPLTLRYYWGQWDRRQLIFLVPTMCVGVALGTWALTVLSDFWLVKTIGAFGFVFASLQLLMMVRDRRLFSTRPHWVIGAVAGILTGIASAMAHLGGSVLGLYMLSLKLSNAAFVATITAGFAFVNLVKLGAYWHIGVVTPRILAASVLSVPLVAAGAFLGYRVNRVLPRRWFEIALITLALVGSIDLLLKR